MTWDELRNVAPQSKMYYVADGHIEFHISGIRLVTYVRAHFRRRSITVETEPLRWTYLRNPKDLHFSIIDALESPTLREHCTHHNAPTINHYYDLYSARQKLQSLRADPTESCNQ